ncbi:MAG TPA: class I SAM-dependent methyltransferase [Acinetobacter ursingii]|uniref:Class I SAM-dependent methyltransferase n=1 Tax=Acinetobacter ursingii TaxID=108980 RepID=A0A3D2SJE7_9GAMM|nr:class I SAM-dependent methyltransferase [Acinetobacter ursingii]MCH2005969.1 class I SAM-dependent methyltransferase [Acinetobacter ursingii]MCU4609403.1 class I SAM-dependent methyltransferase [Acinetobacter ursingii]HCK29163.1 class I SAM-dependent methyltransferase [Acinetobacter ursingii]HCO08452.1 class I SAM-dependent methyltransferase [Acinetobacter ursingii]
MKPIHHAAQQGFSQAAKLYQQVRPDYPNEIVNWLKQELQLDQSSCVVDLGAGTGKFIPYLEQVTSEIIAVEPVQAMREQLSLAHPKVKTLDAYSTEIPLPPQSVDAVLCAQSFHWFANIETLNEIYQLLKTKGHLGLIWNQRDIEVNWVKALADMLQPLEQDTPRYHSGDWKKVFEHQFLFRLESVKVYSQVQKGTVEQVVSQRLLSTSFIAAMTEKQQLELKQQFEQVVYEFTGKQPQDEIEFPYITYAYHFKKI